MYTQQIIRFKQLKKLTGVSRSTISRWEKAGRFPSRLKIGMNTVGWDLSEVNSWLNSLPRGFLSRPSTHKRRRRHK